MWNKSKSLKLSKICIYVFALTGVLICIFLPQWLKYVVESSRSSELFTANIRLLILLIIGYPLAAVCFKALYELHGLLLSVEKGEVFVKENVTRLRVLSWLCITASIMCFIATLFYYQLALLFCLGAFMGLVLRVLKNVFASAVEIKEENDYTI